MTGDRSEVLPAAIPDNLTVDREEEGRIDRAKRGDAVAIDWLITRYRHRVVRLATHILRRPGDAEDVAQEAFVRAFRSLRHYRGEGRFYTWLYQIVVRVCLDRRKLARWDREMPIEALSGSAAEADRSLDAVERRLLVETLLDRLTPPMRAMLVLRELEGLSYEEIAEILQIPVGRVCWRLHTARAQFQEIWLQAAKETDHV
jgi:RNA polymerase sigma-70 factor (ECF subfamily)